MAFQRTKMPALQSYLSFHHFQGVACEKQISSQIRFLAHRKLGHRKDMQRSLRPTTQVCPIGNIRLISFATRKVRASARLYNCDFDTLWHDFVESCQKTRPKEFSEYLTYQMTDMDNIPSIELCPVGRYGLLLHIGVLLFYLWCQCQSGIKFALIAEQNTSFLVFQTL